MVSVAYDRYAVLFEPVNIGPMTTKNRFSRVPHCAGMGYALPKTLSAMRGVVAVFLAVDELLGKWGFRCIGEGREIVECLAELPDLWDVNLSEPTLGPGVLKASTDYVARRNEAIETDRR